MKTAKFIDSLRFRLFWLKHGVRFLRKSQLQIKKVKIAGKTVVLSLPPGEESVMNYEFQNILYDDCYGLWKMEGKVDRVMDVGGNLGFFSLAARNRFPEAIIHSYEPNPKIHKHIQSNTSQFGIQVHPEAIGARDGWIDMDLGEGSLFAKTVESDKGKIKKTAIATALQRIGGRLDLLKLDCEGGEWELFEHKEMWRQVDRLTMEYHLWANPKMEIPEMVKVIRDLGFRIIHLNEAPELKWGVLHATKV